METPVLTKPTEQSASEWLQPEEEKRLDEHSRSAVALERSAKYTLCAAIVWSSLLLRPRS